MRNTAILVNKNHGETSQRHHNMQHWTVMTDQLVKKNQERGMRSSRSWFALREHDLSFKKLSRLWLKFCKMRGPNPLHTRSEGAEIRKKRKKKEEEEEEHKDEDEEGSCSIFSEL